MVMDDKILIQGDLDPKPHQKFILGMGIFGVGGGGTCFRALGRALCRGFPCNYCAPVRSNYRQKAVRMFWSPRSQKRELGHAAFWSG
jgi:hypothetical protein